MSQTAKELVLLMPAFTYIWEGVKRSKEDHNDTSSEDYKLSKRIATQLAYKVKVYRRLQPKALEEWHRIDDEVAKLLPGDHNTFLLGLALLGTHMEVARKKINVGMKNDIMDLQDLCYTSFDSKAIDKAVEYADKVRSLLGM